VYCTTVHRFHTPYVEAIANFKQTPNLDFVFNPHLWYTPNHVKGTVRFSFDLSAEPGASAYVQWRDATSPYHTQVPGSVQRNVCGTIAPRFVHLLSPALEMALALKQANAAL
jgi:hypothetical protein